MPGTVDAVEPGRMVARLDGAARSGEKDARAISVSMNDYNAIDHGYATTIHKNQGATVDRSFVLASGTMDRHLTYVATTRHRDSAQLYASMEEFTDRRADQSLAPGRLVEHGAAPYEHKPGNRDSYFVTLETEAGKNTRFGGWTSNGRSRRPRRSPAKRSGLSVSAHRRCGFRTAGRRGLSERLGIKSEIEIRPDREATAVWIDAPRSGVSLVRGSSEKVGEDLRQETRKDDLVQDRGDDRQQRQRRNPFEGLKLGRGVAAERPQQDRTEKAPQMDPDRPQQAEKQPRGMFDGLKLNAGRGASQERGEASPDARPAPAQERQADRLRPMSGFEQSVDRFAHALNAVERQDRQGLPVLKGQKAELQQAGQQLNLQRPGASPLMVSAMQYDPQTERAMYELSGRERVGQLVAGMDRERALQADPNVRADRLIKTWQELQGERQNLRGWQHDEARGKVEGQMRKVAGSIERDPQVEPIVRSRAQELGIASLQRGRSITVQMEQQLTRGRDLGLERQTCLPAYLQLHYNYIP